MSPRFVLGVPGTSASYSSSTICISSSSIRFDKSNPNALMSSSEHFDSSSAILSASHSASSAVLLSASLYAVISSSVSSSAYLHGAVVIPRLIAALYLVCPQTMTLFRSITSGCCHPNFFRLSATAGTAASFTRGLFSYGRMSSSLFSMISILCLSFSAYCRPVPAGAEVYRHEVIRDPPQLPVLML